MFQRGVQNRSGSVAEFHAADSGGWLEISTSKMKLRYRLGSGALGSGNLLISWSDEQAIIAGSRAIKMTRIWWCAGDIAGRATAGTELGPLTRNGYFLLDDSHTAVWNSAGEWGSRVAPTDFPGLVLFCLRSRFQKFFSRDEKTRSLVRYR